MKSSKCDSQLLVSSNAHLISTIVDRQYEANFWSQLLERGPEARGPGRVQANTRVIYLCQVGRATYLATFMHARNHTTAKIWHWPVLRNVLPVRAADPRFHAILSCPLCRMEGQQFVGIVSCKTRPCSPNRCHARPDVQLQTRPQ